MKVFISWSGSKSNRIAHALRLWLPTVIQSVDPWMSDNDIQAGQRWSSKLVSQLDETDIGLVCLTRDNKDKPWLMFEAGSLSKSLAHGRVIPLLYDLDVSFLSGPIAQFQGKQMDEAGLWATVESINACLGSSALASDILRKSFDRFWPDLEQSISDIREDYGSEPFTLVPSDSEVLSDVLAHLNQDICYIHNFDETEKPHRLLVLPAGTGARFRRDMANLSRQAADVITGAFESEDYQTRSQVIEDEFKERPRHELKEIEARAREQGLVLLRSPSGIAFGPTRDGEVMSQEEFQQLSSEEQEDLQQTVEGFQIEVQNALREMPRWDRERLQKVYELEREVVILAIEPLFAELRERYMETVDAIQHIDAVMEAAAQWTRELVTKYEGFQNVSPQPVLPKFRVSVR